MNQPSPIPQDITACPDCDLLVHTGDARIDREGHCPRCNALLWGTGNRSSDLYLAAALSGLFLFLPAITAPILKLTMVGQHGSSSLLTGVWRLWAESEELLALLILLCSIVAPCFHLLLTCAIGISQRLNRFSENFPAWLKWHRWTQSWSMLEVYAIGIIVAYVKMTDDGEVTVASGTYCLAALLFCMILCNQYFREERVWQQWEHRGRT